MRGSRIFLDAGQHQQVIVDRALLGIAKNLIGAHNLPEPLPSVWITGSEIGMGALDGPAECGPETFGIVLWKRPKQIVKRVHRRSRCRISTSPSEIRAGNLPRSTHAT